MFILNRFKPRYKALPLADDDEEAIKHELGIQESSKERHATSRSRWLHALCLSGIICLIVGFFSASILKAHIFHLHSSKNSDNPPQTCTNPSLRREWRSLAAAEKKAYIDAVKCLGETPSVLGLNQTLYADFPWVHNRIGEYCMTCFSSENL